MMMRYGSMLHVYPFISRSYNIIKIRLNSHVCCYMVCDAGLCEADAIIDVYLNFNTIKIAHK